MEKYHYNDELPTPPNYGAINLGNPVMFALVRIMGKHLGNTAKKYQPEAGISKKSISVPVRDGNKIGCYILEPENCSEKLTTVILYHGGGFLMPSQETTIRNAAHYAKQLNCRVFVPEYRLAPKYVFPVPFQDCYDVLLYIEKYSDEYLVDKNKIIIYGDSAGGCLAAAVTLACRDLKGPKVLGQMLIYPAISHTSDYKSMEDYKDAVWSRDANQQMWKRYLKNGDCRQLKYAVPMTNKNFQKLPQTYVEPQEMDTLKDEAIKYAEKLQEAGVPVEVNIIPGSYHGFDSAYDSPLVQRVLKKRCQVMKNMLEE